MKEKEKNLYYLDDLSNYKVASDDSNVKGWKVKDADQRTVGKVDRLLVNKETKRVVYLDVEVDATLIEDGHEVYNTSASEGAHEFVNKKGENHLIIPIGTVRIDEENKYVISNEINYNTFSRTKRVSKGADIDRKYEITVLGQYFPDRSHEDETLSDEEFYNRQEFNRSEEPRR
jgi:hypothetical protein